MASSDSEEFASADEASPSDGHERRRRSKRQSSSNYDSEDGNPGGTTKAQAAKDSPIAKAAGVFEPKASDGWDDFEIQEDETETAEHFNSAQNAKIISPANTTETLVKSVQDTKKHKIPVAEDDAKKATASEQVTSTGEGGDGWDKFDDWGDGNDEVSTPITNAPKQSPEEDKIKSVADRLSGLSSNEGGGGRGGTWGWGGWGESLLSTATAGISTLTNTVSQGISTVSTVLESGIGAPDPEELARRNLDHSEGRSEPNKEHTASEESQDAEYLSKSSSGEGSFALGSIMSGVSHITKFVENTGSKVITGGLDTLETIGKKTMEVLQDGDPGLAKKRAMLGLDSGHKPVLSQVLREAKTKADEEDMFKEQKREAKEVHYETLFDDFEGLVHLEALEMLSRQVGMRIEERMRNLSPEKRLEMKETLQQVAELCELPDSDDEADDDSRDPDLTRPEMLNNRLREATQDIGVNLQFQHLVKQFEETLAWIDNKEATEKAVYKKGVSSLAQCTALSVEVYHKTAEMLLVKTRRSTADEADALTQMTTVLTRHMSELAADFTQRLSALTSDENKEQVNTYITNVFLEAGNSSTYIQSAFQLTLPILQIGAA